VVSVNGRIADSELTPVYGGQLANATAAAWLAMVAAASRDGVSLVIAGGTSIGGSGAYRNLFVQGDMKKRPWLYGLSSYSTVRIASAGYSTHGFGTSLDIGSFPPARSLNAYGNAGRSRRAWVLANAAKFGFTRTFGEADPNHFGHNGTGQFLSAAAAINLEPIPEIEPEPLKEEEETMSGAFYRVSEGQGVNGVYWQAEPNAPLLLLDSVQWYTYEANGAKFKNWTAVELEPLMRRCGVFNLDTLGRIKHLDSGAPDVWLPGL